MLDGSCFNLLFIIATESSPDERLALGFYGLALKLYTLLSTKPCNVPVQE